MSQKNIIKAELSKKRKELNELLDCYGNSVTTTEAVSWLEMINGVKKEIEQFKAILKCSNTSLVQ